MNTIKEMSEDARLWVYQSSTLLSDAEKSEIEEKGRAFIENWTAHGAALKASFDILYHRFIIISVDEKQAMASGCSIDKSLAFIKSLEQQFNLTLLDRMQVAYKNQQNIEVCSLSEFEKMVREGKVNEATIVFNNMITTKAEFNSVWQVPLKDSWQKKVLN